MNKNENPYDVEFLDPNRNYEITMQELRNRIENLRLDIIQANDPEVKGFAEKRYIDLRIKYFQLMRDDLTLQKLYEEQEEVE